MNLGRENHAFDAVGVAVGLTCTAQGKTTASASVLLGSVRGDEVRKGPSEVYGWEERVDEDERVYRAKLLGES